jgi:hypothetical protein
LCTGNGDGSDVRLKVRVAVVDLDLVAFDFLLESYKLPRFVRWIVTCGALPAG